MDQDKSSNFKAQNPNFYNVILQNYEVQQLTDKQRESLETQSNIKRIQKSFLDFAAEGKSFNIDGVNVLPLASSWNFAALYVDGRATTGYTFNFEPGTNVAYSTLDVILLQLYVFYLITEYGINNGQNGQRLYEAKGFIEFLIENNINSIEFANLNDYKSYYEIQNISYSTMVKQRRTLRTFVEFYSLFVKDIFTRDLYNWFEDIDTDRMKAEQKQGLTKLVTTEYFSTLRDILWDEAYNEENDIFSRGKCALLYIGTQTGLRAHELCLLRVEDLEVWEQDNKKAGIIRYRTTKPKRGKRDNPYIIKETNANEKIVEIWLMLQKLFDNHRKKNNTNILSPKKKATTKKGFKTFVYKSSALATELIRINVKHCKELNTLNTNVEWLEGNATVGHLIEERYIFRSSLKKWGLSSYLNDNDTISYIITRQFRTYVDTERDAKGIDVRTRRKLYGHSSPSMDGYYSRLKHNVQEDIDYSESIVKSVYEEDADILGPKGEEYKQKINEIERKIKRKLKRGINNVEENIEDIIVKAVLDEVPIRQKELGFCMLSMRNRTCRIDAKVDDFLCAYGVCPCQCHMYFNLPVTLSMIKDMLKIYKYNKDNGFINQSQKEGYKIIATINKNLIPELDSARKQLTKMRKEEIIRRHPDMSDVIDRLDEIEQEASKWKKMLS